MIWRPAFDKDNIALHKSYHKRSYMDRLVSGEPSDSKRNEMLGAVFDAGRQSYSGSFLVRSDIHGAEGAQNQDGFYKIAPYPEDTLSLNLNNLRDLPAISSPLGTPADQHATNSSLAHTLTATSLETMSGLSDVVVAPLPQFTSPEADLVLVTSDGQEFRVFSRFLIETSGVFRDLLDLPTSPNSSERIMTISETARTLNLLLQYIYPMAHPVLASLSDIQTVLLAADKYDVSFITDDLRAKLVSPAVLGTSPIKAYAVACRLGMHEEALKAAQETFSLDFAEKDLEGDRDIRLRTHDAFALFRFQKNRVNAVINVLLATPKPINCEGCSTRHFYGRPAWQASYIERCAMVLQRTGLVQADRMGLFDLEVVLNAAKFTTCGCEKCITSVTSDSQLVDRWLKTLLNKMKEAEDRVTL
ncbi:hypothetical protein BN14_00340 [Rhizoctonia solani AG-1 IB]|uniref:BTB domain-containing protein n=1 Tax=Thanatephorus cucumeris (strain AG1-IB / isolate 7/3/14) TaxID=1108050 RepID=M5BJV3_THACB|nr:hypothetical protein BN14_00340 [Rhizoctonia solani AG-1 IB]